MGICPFSACSQVWVACLCNVMKWSWVKASSGLEALCLTPGLWFFCLPTPQETPGFFPPSPSFHFSSFSFSLGERGMKLQKSLCFLVRRQAVNVHFWRAPSSTPLRVAKPKDADKAYRPEVQIASHKNLLFLSSGEGSFQCELLCVGCIKV